MFPDPVITSALQVILEETGIVTPPHRYYVVREALRHAGESGGDPEACLKRLMTDQKLWLAMISTLTIGETYLFRHFGHYEVLRDFAARRRQMGRSCRVLCAGCATGEEAWSAAAVLADVYGAQADRAQVVGWDIDQARIVEARRGRYRRWSVRHGLKRYGMFFDKHDDLVVAGDKLRALVEFETVNLAKAPLPARGRFDAIFFRNVAIYWTAERTEEVLGGLATFLVDDGLLFVGPADPVRMGAGWDKRIDHDAILFALSRTPASQRRIRTAPPAGKAASFSEVSVPVVADVVPCQDGLDEVLEQAGNLADQGCYEQAWSLLAALPKPTPVAARLLRGIVLMNLERFEEAVRVFRQCVCLAPHERAHRQWLAVAYDTMGWAQEAQREWRNLARMTDSGPDRIAASDGNNERGACS